MAKWHTLQNSFAAGEISPDYAAQVDNPFTRVALAEAVNAVIFKSGAVAKAPGTRFVSDTGFDNVNEGGRIWGFMDPDANEWLLATFLNDKVYISNQLDQSEPPDGMGWFASNTLSGDSALNGDFDDVTPVFGYTDKVGYPDQWRSLIRQGGQYTPNAGSRTNPLIYSKNPYAVQAFDLSDEFLFPTYGYPTDDTLSLRCLYASDSAGTGDPNSWDTAIDLDGLYIREDGVAPTPGADPTDALSLVPRGVFEFAAPADLDAVAVRLRVRRPVYSRTYGDDGDHPTITRFPDSMVGIRVRVAIAANEFTGPALLDQTIMMGSLGLGDADDFVFSNSFALGTVAPGAALVCSIGLVTSGVDAYLQGSPAPEGEDAGYLAHLWVDNAEIFTNGVGTPLNSDELTTGYTASQVENLHFVQSPFDNKELICLTPGVAPQRLHRPAGVWTFSPYVFTAPPAAWAGTSQPDVACAYQGRLYLSGASSAPETIWGSKTFDWKDITLGSGAADAVEFTPTARGQNTWLGAAGQLLFGNTRSEFSVVADQGIVAAGDIGVFPQTAFGSLRMPQKVDVGGAIAIPTAGSRQLRLLEYSDRRNGFRLQDISEHAEHLFKQGVRRMLFVRDPRASIWCVLNDGRVVIGHFDEGNQLPTAWTQLQTGGKVTDLTALYSPEGETLVYALVLRPASDGVETLNLEVFNNLRERADWRYTNSTLEVANTAAATSVSGFDHLEDTTVAVFEDGVYVGEQTVSGGALTVDAATLRVVAGVPYTFKATGMPEGSVDMVAAGGLAAKKRYAKVGVRVRDSGPPLINGNRAPDRTPPMEMDANPVYEGVFDYEVGAQDWDREAGITVEEALPFGITLLATYGILSHNDV